MSALSPEEVDFLLPELPRTQPGHALVHEAAVMAWCIDNNLVPYGVDVLVDGPTWARLETSADLSFGPMGCLAVERGGIPVRAWREVAGRAYDPARTVWSKVVQRRCMDPLFVLDALPSSPDWRYVLELRAGLAMVLFADEIPDEQLARFRDHVRCV